MKNPSFTSLHLCILMQLYLSECVCVCVCTFLFCCQKLVKMSDDVLRYCNFNCFAQFYDKIFTQKQQKKKQPTNYVVALFVCLFVIILYGN